MKFAAVLAPLALSVLSVSAKPWGPGGGNWGNWQGHGNCLTDAEAQSIADRSIIYLMHTDVALANQTAQGLFADNIQEYGDSINSLKGDALGNIVEDGKQHYITDTISSPAIPKIETITIVKGCTQMVWQWRFYGIGSGVNRVQGMTLITVDANKMVSEQYVEFNSLAWAEDAGFTVTPPSGGLP